MSYCPQNVCSLFQIDDAAMHLTSMICNDAPKQAWRHNSDCAARLENTELF